MADELTYIMTPLIGGVIGYITNDIAIRMLFRPHRAKYVWGIHIPFTPGIIPKEKGRISEAIGNVVSENFMNNEVLTKYLLADEMVGKVRAAVCGFLGGQQENPETVSQFLCHYFSEEEVSRIVRSVNENLTGQVQAKLLDPSVGETIARLTMDRVSAKLNGDGASEILAGLGGMMGGIGGATTALLGQNVVSKFLELLRKPAEKFLGNHINKMFREDGSQMVGKLLGDEVRAFLDTPVRDVLAGKEELLQQLADGVVSVYSTVIREHLPRILASVDISKIIRERIQEMDVNETEKLIFQVMDKELKAIVWLGALLGLLMGGVNCFLI